MCEVPPETALNRGMNVHSVSENCFDSLDWKYGFIRFQKFFFFYGCSDSFVLKVRVHSLSANWIKDKVSDSLGLKVLINSVAEYCSDSFGLNVRIHSISEICSDEIRIYSDWNLGLIRFQKIVRIHSDWKFGLIRFQNWKFGLIRFQQIE